MGKLFFLPLGGCNEIGMNLNLYCYDEQWLMVDMGVSFERNLGIEVVMPDPAFIVKNKSKLQGLVLTHAHEDHIGAIPHLWERLQCPVYATPFTAYLVREKLKQAGLENQVELIEVDLNGTKKVGNFEVEFVDLTHSIPEPNALAITTPAGTILHTGDWKIDPEPIVGSKTNISRLKQLGDDGVLAMVCDSTNVFDEGFSGSEADVQENLIKTVKGKKGRVIVACFASNVARIATAAKVAAETGRKILLAGQSMHRIEGAARKSGYLDGVEGFLDVSAYKSLPKNEVMLLCTGSQGETRAALTRIAYNDFPGVTVEPGDHVYFSSREIPGNEEAIQSLQAKLMERGVTVITSKKEFIHVSGHPARGELKQMYEWVRPEILIPVHGENHHLIEHARYAKTCGIKHSIVPYNGSFIEISNDGAKIIGKRDAGKLALDGNELVPYESGHIKQRSLMMQEGVVSATVVMGSRGTLFARPQISLVGVVESNKESWLVSCITDAIYSGLKKADSNILNNIDKLRDYLIKTVKRSVRMQRDKKSLIVVHIVRLKEKTPGGGGNNKQKNHKKDG